MPLQSSYSTQDMTLVDFLRQRAQAQPHQVAYTFLRDGKTEKHCLTYQQLEQKVIAIAAHLQSISSPGDRALLLYPSGLDFIISFFACLYAGVIAVPAYPPRHNQKLSRLQTIVQDAQATLLLTTTEFFPLIKNQAVEGSIFKQTQYVLTDQITTQADNFLPITIESQTIAFLQYTSGSTGTPKGVMISHSNLIHNLNLIEQTYPVTSDNIGLNWLPVYHDMGLVGGILYPIAKGFSVIFMSPTAFLQDPIHWLRLISTYKVTMAGGPNFAYDLCVQKAKPEQLTNLDLSSWKIAVNGAEPIKAKTIASFIDKFTPYGFQPSTFRPSYGLAEATVLVTGINKASSPVIKVCDAKALEQNQAISCIFETSIFKEIVSCGYPCLDQIVAIVDPVSLTRCPAGQIGEIWVKGKSIAQGYWQQEELTQQTFHAYLADTQEGPFLRTGDLGFWEDEAGLFVTGRIKDILIIQGRNHYPQDIEQTLESSHPSLNFHGCAAFSTEIDGEHHLIVACEVKRTHLRYLQVEEVAKAIRKAVLKNHDLQIHQVLLLKPGTLPKTSSGKIQRLACCQGFLNKTLSLITAENQVVSPNSDTDINIQLNLAKKLQAWISQWLAKNLKIPLQSIDLQISFLDYGLDSLNTAIFIQDLQEFSGYLLTIPIVLEFPTIASLSSHIAEKISSQNSFTSNLKSYPENTLGEYSSRIPLEDYQIEEFPEYIQLQKQLTEIQTIGIPNPYFQVQESLTRNNTQIQGRTLINYSTYNYLGLSGDVTVSEAAKAAIDLYGTSVCASRLASGERLLHQELEQELADFIGVEDCIVYVSGHATNVTTIGHLFNSQDLIFYDILSHNSILQGISLSGARAIPFPHNDWEALGQMLQNKRQQYRRVLLVIEGVYSMDGDIPDLPKFIELKQRYKTLLMVDEAHSMGVLGHYGRGIGEFFGVERNQVDLWMGTLSKAFASCGGYIAGSKALVSYLKYTSPGFVYSVGLSPADTAAALTSLRLLNAEPERVRTLQQRSQYFLQLAQARGWNTSTSQNSPIIPIIVGNTLSCIHLSHALFKAGINVQPMIYPAVPQDAARLRFFMSCLHTEEQIKTTITALAMELDHVKPSTGQ